jgi:hypothetical protein
MTDREKLIELLEQKYYCSIEELADYLIANGVTLDNQVSFSGGNGWTNYLRT